MTESLLDKTRRMMAGVAEGKFVEGMEEFYADDAINEEPNGTRIEGKAAIIANEKEILANVAAFHGAKLISLGTGIDDGKGNGVTFAEYSLAVDMQDGSKFNPEQVQVTRWQDGKAKHIRFYYNPSFQ